MIGLTCILANAPMCFLRKNLLVRIPEITKGVAGLIVFWNLVPQSLASFGTVIPYHKRHNLARPSAKCCPQPIFCRFDEDKRPDFIQFKDIFTFGRQKALLDSWLLGYFF